jgi:DNA-binding FadR family transcriptional regulator
MEICRAADNRILDRIMYSARWLGTASRRVTNEAPAGLRRATAQHTEIYDALVARDPEGARAAMRGHLSNNYSTLLAEKEQRSKRAAKRR